MRVREVSIRYAPGPKVATPAVLCPRDVAHLALAFIGEGEPREHFITILLDTRHRPLAIERVSVGIANASLVHPREVFRAAIVAGAAAMILAHNHPSGDVSPSLEDLSLTRRLVDAGKLLGVSVLDHVVVGDGGGFHSMSESGTVAFKEAA